MDEAAKEGDARVRRSQNSTLEIDLENVRVRFSDEARRAIAALHKTLKAKDGGGDSGRVLTLREFAENDTANLKALIVELPAIAQEIEAFGDDGERATLDAVLSELGGDKGVVVSVPARKAGRVPVRGS